MFNDVLCNPRGIHKWVFCLCLPPYVYWKMGAYQNVALVVAQKTSIWWQIDSNLKWDRVKYSDARYILFTIVKAINPRYPRGARCLLIWSWESRIYHWCSNVTKVFVRNSSVCTAFSGFRIFITDKGKFVCGVRGFNSVKGLLRATIIVK